MVVMYFWRSSACSLHFSPLSKYTSTHSGDIRMSKVLTVVGMKDVREMGQDPPSRYMTAPFFSSMLVP